MPNRVLRCAKPEAGGGRKEFEQMIRSLLDRLLFGPKRPTEH
jgi:hypothetical protein